MPREEINQDFYPEQEVIDYLKSWNHNLKQDEYGNLYLINPWTPLLSAHMDTVQNEEDVVNMPKIKINKKKWTISYKDSIIWWDDKCWIAMAMELYEKYGNKVSLIFSRQEETWHRWASAFCEKHSDLLKQCKYCIVMDRRNAWDIIWYNNWYCSEEFQQEIHRCTKDFGYNPTTWSLSDADAFSRYINCVNLSTWYYKAHTSDEYIVVDEMKNAVKAVENIIENFKWEYEIYKEPERKVGSFPKYRMFGYRWVDWKWHEYYWWSYYDYDDYDYWYYYNKSQLKNDKSKDNSKIKDNKSNDKKDNDNKWTERQEYVKSFFKLNKDWDVEVTEDLMMVNKDYPDELYELPKWTYVVLTYDEFSEYEASLYEEYQLAW